MPIQRSVDAATALTEVIQNMADLQYAPNDAEWALVYRAICDAQNPRQPLWAVAGALFGGALVVNTPLGSSFLGKSIAVFASALYSVELSWTFRDRHPATTFFDDVKHIRSGMTKICTSPIARRVDSRPLGMCLIDFLLLGRTLEPLRSQSNPYVQHRLSCADKWVLGFQKHLSRDADTFLQKFWQWKISRLRRFRKTA